MSTDVKFVKLDIDVENHPLFRSYHERDRSTPDEVLEALNDTIQEVSVCYNHGLPLATIGLCGKVIELLLVRAYNKEFERPPIEVETRYDQRERRRVPVTDNEGNPRDAQYPSGDPIPMTVNAIRTALRRKTGTDSIFSDTYRPKFELIQAQRNIAVHGSLQIPDFDVDAFDMVKTTIQLVERIIYYYCPKETAIDFVQCGKVRANFGNHEEAIEDFDKAIKRKGKAKLQDENLAQAHYNRGISRAALSKDEEAIQDFDKAIELECGLAKNHFNRGKAYANLGEYDKVIEGLDKAIKSKGAKLQDDDLAQAYYYRGKAKNEQGKHEEAIADFDEAIKLKGDFSDAYFDRGVVKNTLEQNDSALADFDKAISLNPDNAKAYHFRGRVKCELNLKDSAIVDFDGAIRLDPDNQKAIEERGHARNEVGQYGLALRDLTQVIQRVPRNLRAYTGRAQANIRADTRGAQAALETQMVRSDVDRALGLNPKDPLANFYDGYLKAESGEYKNAILAYSVAIDFSTDNYIKVKAYNNRGWVKNRLEEYEAAIEDCNEAIRLNPKYADAYSNRGCAKNELKQHEAAIENYNEAIRLNPEDANAYNYNNRGWANISLEQYEEAIEDYNKAGLFSFK